uniref:Cell cycle checkpoint control protein RAD9A n=1 Tax=Zea mays TaxID=4577 RepID=A0A804LK50_MAIZE
MGQAQHDKTARTVYRFSFRFPPLSEVPTEPKPKAGESLDRSGRGAGGGPDCGNGAVDEWQLPANVRPVRDLPRARCLRARAPGAPRQGVRKTYWIVCSAEPEVQSLSLDRGRFPSRLAIRPRELARLLSNFQSSLQELTIIATDPASGLPDASGDVGGKAVELRSYNDPTKDDCDTRLHTQLWIDPAEEFVEFVHAGDPVDVTFGVKELKAFLTFCEGCEVDILLFFEKTGEPVLLVPRFGLDDGAASDFEATLVLATMTVSQLSDSDDAQQPATSAQNAGEPGAAAPTLVPENVSNHTKIWSELSGSTPKSIEANRENHAQKKRNASTNMLNDMSMLPNVTNAPSKPPVADNANNIMQPLQMDHMEERPEGISGIPRSQHHPSNWVGADDNDDDNEDDEELLVQTTPYYMD